jgi:hypothetical protein
MSDATFHHASAADTGDSKKYLLSSSNGVDHGSL